MQVEGNWKLHGLTQRRFPAVAVVVAVAVAVVV